MANFTIIRADKLSNSGSIGGSGKHVFRERETPNAIEERTHLNVVLTGARSSAELHAAIKARTDLATHKAKDAVLCIEYLVAASPEAKCLQSREAALDYFKAALEWFRVRHGTENVVCAVVHFDELSPHMSVHAVPIVARGGHERKYSVGDGRNEDGTARRKTITKIVDQQIWLSAYDFLGGRKKLAKLQTDFAAEVGKQFGLVRGVENSRATHKTVKAWYGELPAGPNFENASRDAIMKFGRDAFVAATRQKEMLKEQQQKAEMAKAEAQKQLDALRAQAQAATGVHQSQLQAVERTIAVQSEKIRALGAQIRAQGTDFGRRIGDLLKSIWQALSEPGGAAAARRLLQAAARELAPNRTDLVCQLLPEPPELRVELRELSNGGWRASVLDRDDQEVWSELHDVQDDAREAAEAWIQEQKAAPAPGW
jgi:hypothetical protein